MSAPTVALPAHDGDLLVDRSHRFEAMGGSVTLRVATPTGGERAADHDLHLVAARIRSWAGRITRFEADSELSRLNRSADAPTSLVGPSLGHLLGLSRQLAVLTDGLVDITQLGPRLAAEHGGIAERSVQRWSLGPAGRRLCLQREGAVSFDLDGVGKGWIADRALRLLSDYAAAMVDADGDVALRPGRRHDWAVGITDPRSSTDLGVIVPPVSEPGVLGIATSGTSVHRWELDGGWAHHLIDPRTGRSAVTDVVQATVVADGALQAEAVAKAVVIVGSDAGLRLLERSRAHTGFLLLHDGDLIAPPGAEAWLV